MFKKAIYIFAIIIGLILGGSTLISLSTFDGKQAQTYAEEDALLQGKTGMSVETEGKAAALRAKADNIRGSNWSLAWAAFLIVAGAYQLSKSNEKSQGNEADLETGILSNNSNRKSENYSQNDSQALRRDSEDVTAEVAPSTIEVSNRNLDNDAYKIYLVEKYKISKNEVLGKYVLTNKLYENLEDVLKAALLLDTTASTRENTQDENLNKTNVTKEAIISESSNSAKSKIYENNVKKPQTNEENLIKFLIRVIIAAVVVIIFVAIMLFLSGFFSGSETNSPPTQKKSSRTIIPDKDYKDLREDILSSDWKIYKRKNEIKDWDNKPYPEVDSCYEDICVASFISADKSKVREITFGFCSAEGHVRCPNKPTDFETVDDDRIKTKSESDADFLRRREGPL